jgi:hypothetical protein
VFAFAIIAAIIVEAETNPRLPKKIVSTKAVKFAICNSVISTKRITINKFNESVSIKLKNNLPRKIDTGGQFNFKDADVSFSSSFINILASPLIAEKKITIHNNPDNISFSTFSSPSENLIIEIVTTTNIRSELIT